MTARNSPLGSSPALPSAAHTQGSSHYPESRILGPLLPQDTREEVFHYSGRLGTEAAVVHGTLGSLGWDALSVTMLPGRASGTRRMVLSGDSMTRWVHMVNGLPFSSVTDVRDCPLPLLVHPHVITFPCHAAWTLSRSPSVPLAGGSSSWRSRSDALDPASAI